jgi:hypothetical protein
MEAVWTALLWFRLGGKWRALRVPHNAGSLMARYITDGLSSSAQLHRLVISNKNVTKLYK